ncbi:MAG: hypothetical protein HDT48_02190 [Ruminococcaceae bacterium]|nr:hypothetical protein [Oscillospiraceae bacterium]
MKKILYCQHIYNCESTTIDTYFEYGNSVVFCTSEKIKSYGCKRTIKCAKIKVISKCTKEEYWGPSEIDRCFRKENLVIQGIISFFTGSPLTVYNSNSSTKGFVPIPYQKQRVHLNIEGIDYTSDLKILLRKLTEEPELIITLLDRWRKAIYLKSESVDADLYYDEATLSFFHILELFGDKVNNELKKMLEKNIERMMQQHFACYYFDDTHIKQKIEQNKKAVNSILIGDFLSLSVKIKYFLEKYNLLDDKVSYFIDNMIKVRNEIAHGRITYQKMFVWPLPPFFSLAKNPYENTEFLMQLTAVMISKYVGIKRWEKEWIKTKLFLMPSQQIMTSFLEGKIYFENDAKIALVKGNKYNITWRTIFNFYIQKPKKEIREEIELVVAKPFIDTPVNRRNAPDIFNISLIFADSEDINIQKKAIENIKFIVKNGWYNWSNIRDAYIYLEFYSVDVVWYKNFLDSKEYLKIK